MAYVHPENQKLLWNTIQKTPIFNNLGSQQTQWFKSVIQHFYEEYPNAKTIKTKDELQTINRATISFMVNSLKEMFQPKQTPTPSSETSYENTSLPSTTGSNERVSYYNDQFNNRQKEYESMNAKPLPPTNSIVDEKISDEAITNMDELIRQQIEQRELELKMYGQSPMSKKISINEDVQIPINAVIHAELNNEIVEERPKRNVSWKDENNELTELKKIVAELSDTINIMKEELERLKNQNNNVENNSN
jgi:uncharacterized small protein (DUF1192 family)